MQAIRTHFQPCTNFRGSRVIAKAQAGRVCLDWDHALNPDANHALAARTLAARFQWLDTCDLVSGVLADGSHVHVLVTR